MKRTIIIALLALTLMGCTKSDSPVVGKYMDRGRFYLIHEDGYDEMVSGSKYLKSEVKEVKP